MAVLSENGQFLLVSIPYLIFMLFLAILNAQCIMSKAKYILPPKYYLEVKAEGTFSLQPTLVYAFT